MNSHVDRFVRRQQIRTQLKNSTQLVAMLSGPEVDRLMQSSVDQAYLDQVQRVTSLGLPTAACENAVGARLDALAVAFNQQRFDQLLDDSRRGALQAIVGPFGLGKVLSAFDKNGGNVDTIHNARSEVYATKKATQAYKDRGDYDKAQYHGNDERYKKAAKEAADKQQKGELKDAYTGDTLGPKERASIDHTIAAALIHNDRGRVLAGLDGPELANRPTNLNSTTLCTNSSMGQGTTEDYLKRIARIAEWRAKQLAKLRDKQASNEPLTEKEEAKLKIYAEQEKIAQNPELLLERDRIAREDYEKSINDTYYKGEQFRKACLHTSAKEGGKMAFQAATGVVLVEFFSACFDEIGDWYRNGAQEARLGTELKRRMEHISQRVASRWKAVFVAAGTGFISGLLSNLVTVMINTFLTTAKRVVRMIREGALSLLEACKTLLIRPEGMTFAQAIHKSSKVLIGAGVVVAGVMLEEVVSKFLTAIPIMVPFADLATAVIVGATTAIISTVAVYLIDKLDLFGVNRDQLLTYMNQELDRSNEQEIARENALLDNLEEQLACYEASPA